ncbi:hypothetical protein C8F04DRAFT_387986 [Mycena alexandri]|uniref:C2H2-type domain-containing protein n=1 Tax=Mycena alexandri TaxID=1745969 RepID=A0AAD6T236_9AGAR|nr:hypothetical protein C8F04DRAFT_387986 [Mycena alexandri]
MGRQISSIVYNFEPDFPDSAVERYPSLTCALGNFYPGVRTSAGPVDEDEEDYASERVSDHGAPSPMSFNGMPSSSGSESTWPFETAVPVIPSYTQDVYPGDEGFSDGMNQSYNNSILAMNSFPRSSYLRHTHSEDAAEIPNADTFLNFDNFFPICAKTPMGDLIGIKSEDPSDAALSSTPCPPGPPVMDLKEESDSRRIKRRKRHRCSACPDSFIRLSDLRQHESMHSEQPVHHKSSILPDQLMALPAAKFVCNFPGCLKEFGVRSNLNRHQVSHGIKRRGRGRPAAIVPYAVKFADPALPPSPVHSDTASLPAPVIWDDDNGPFSWHPSVAREAAQNDENNAASTSRHM